MGSIVTGHEVLEVITPRVIWKGVGRELSDGRDVTNCTT